MKFLNAAELAALLPQLWQAEGEADADIIRAAIRRRPEHMRRIHDIVALTRPPFDGSSFLYRPLAGKKPIEYLADGDNGILALDAYLVRIFQKAAPAHLFDIPTGHTDPDLEGVVLLNLLWEREGALPGGSGTIHDPIRFDRRVIHDGTRRLAAAIANHLSSEDSAVARRILRVALNDDDRLIRLSALSTSGWLSGYPEIAGAIAAMKEDPESEVRIAAIRALAVRREMPEMIGEIAEFLHDGDPAVRKEVLATYFQRPMQPGSLAPLARAVFDPNDDVKALAELVVPDEEVTAFVRRLARAAESGERMELRDLIIVVGSDRLQDDEKVKVLARRLIKLSERNGDDEEYGHVLEAMLAWRDQPPEDMFLLLAEMPMIVRNGRVAPWFARLARNCDTPLAWPLFNSFLRMPPGEIDEGARAAISDHAGAHARHVPVILEGLTALIQDRKAHPKSRYSAIYAVRKAGFMKETATVLSTIAFSQSEEPEVAKAATSAMAGILPPDQAREFLSAAASAGIPAVQDYAMAAMRRLADEPEAPSTGPKVIDIKQARKRRLGKSSSKLVDKE